MFPCDFAVPGGLAIVPWASELHPLAPAVFGSVVLPGTPNRIAMEHIFTVFEAVQGVEGLEFFLTFNISDVPTMMDLLDEWDDKRMLRLWEGCDLVADVEATNDIWLDSTDHDGWPMYTITMDFNLTAYSGMISGGTRFEWIVDTTSAPPVPFYLPGWKILHADGALTNFTVPYCEGTLPADNCPNCMSESRSHSMSSSASPNRTESSSHSVSSIFIFFSPSVYPFLSSFFYLFAILLHGTPPAPLLWGSFSRATELEKKPERSTMIREYTPWLFIV